MKKFFEFFYIDAQKRTDGLIMFSLLAIINFVEFFTFWFWLHGVLAILSSVLVAVLYEGGKLLDCGKEKNDGQRN